MSSNNGEDELRSSLLRRLVGTTVGTLYFVHGFRTRTDDSRGIVVYCRVVSSHLCGFNECRAVARCVRCHRPNEADEVVGSSRFVIQDLEEERRHDLPYSSEFCFGWLSAYRLEFFKRIGEFCHDFSGFIVSGGSGLGSGLALFRVKCLLRGR